MTTAKPRRTAKWFVRLVVVPVGCAAIVLAFVPEAVFRISYGRGPLRAAPTQVKEGMTPEQVIAILGPPHRRDDEDGEMVWTYFEDVLTANAISVKFKKTERVSHWWVRE